MSEENDGVRVCYRHAVENGKPVMIIESDKGKRYFTFDYNFWTGIDELNPKFKCMLLKEIQLFYG